jgi:hypothetical protein
VLLPGADLQVDARRLALQAGEQARQQRERDEVVGHDGEAAFGDRRIEGRGRLQSLLEREQRRAQRSGQRERALGRLHAAALAHQQGIAEVRAQLPQRIADGGLRQAHARARAADAAFGQQRVQHGQQVHVQRRDIHDANIAYTNHPFVEYAPGAHHRR